MRPYEFDEFFLTKKEESISPFLTPSSQKWARSLRLKGSVLASFLLILSYLFAYFSTDFSYILLTFVYLLVSPFSLLTSLKLIKEKKWNIFVLTSISGFFALFMGKAFEGALLFVLFELSTAIEQKIRLQTQRAIHSLSKKHPQKARVIDDKGKIKEKSLFDISIGEHILIESEEMIPLDGIVVKGSSSISLSQLTGEMTPIQIKEGQEAFAGSMNREGSLVIKITKKSSESTISKIAALIEKAQESKPKIGQIADQISEKYTLLVLGIFILISFISPLFLPLNFFTLEGSVYKGIIFLIAASPCALIISIPSVYLSAINVCAQKGVLLRGGYGIDAINLAKKIGFDKTGTLTKGVMELEKITPLIGSKEEKIAFAIAASLAQKSTHPISQAIFQKAQKENVSLPIIKDFASVAGYGVKGQVEEKNNLFPAMLGNFAFIAPHLSQENQIEATKTLNSLTTPFTLLLFKNTLFLFTFQDELKPHSKNVITQLQSMSLGVTMITGDTKNNGKKIADECGISEYYTDLRPEDKKNLISQMSKTCHLVYVGDGVNDAPSLAQASLGISMGKIGSQLAIEASDAIIMGESLVVIPKLFQIAKKAKKILWQNLLFAGLIILFNVSFALLGFLPLWGAVFLHEGSTLLVGLNSLRIFRKS